MSTLWLNNNPAFSGARRFALENISATLGKELAPFGVHLTAVAPGTFRTD